MTVVTGYLAEQVEELLDGFEVRFARQPEPNGSADAVARALAGGATLPAVISAADSVFRAGDLARFAEGFAASGAAGAIAYSRASGPVSIRVENGHVRRVVDPEPGELSPAPLWGLDRARSGSTACQALRSSSPLRFSARSTREKRSRQSKSDGRDISPRPSISFARTSRILEGHERRG